MPRILGCGASCSKCQPASRGRASIGWVWRRGAGDAARESRDARGRAGTDAVQAGTPEIREYRIRAVIDDVEIGDYSPTLQITVS